MTFRLWPRTPTARAIVGLTQEVRRLTTAVCELTAMQHKDAAQLKRLRDAFAERERAWEAAVHEAAEATAAESRKTMESQRGADSGWLRRFDAVREQLAMDLKWRKIFKHQLTALVRHICIPLEQVPPPLDLVVRRFRLRSQNEEDGILLALLGRAGWGGRRFVEIGSGSTGGNAAVLAHECGWAGLMIDLSAEAIASAQRRFARNPLVALAVARVTPENVNTLLAQHTYEGDVDVLSIDIDSYDYWVLQALTVCSPRILVLEYNALFGPERRVTIPLTHPVEGTPKGYGGASLAALTDLAGRKGYRLVACEEAGVNAFFLRHDTAPDVPAVSVAVAYRPLRGRRGVEDAEDPTDIFAVAGRHGLPLVDV
jgi:hypothetical protein